MPTARHGIPVLLLDFDLSEMAARALEAVALMSAQQLQNVTVKTLRTAKWGDREVEFIGGL